MTKLIWNDIKQYEETLDISSLLLNEKELKISNSIEILNIIFEKNWILDRKFIKGENSCNSICSNNDSLNICDIYFQYNKRFYLVKIDRTNNTISWRSWCDCRDCCLNN